MRRIVAIVLSGLVAVGLGVALIDEDAPEARPSAEAPPPPPRPAAHVHNPPTPVPQGVGSEAEDRRGPNGMPIPADAPVKVAGWEVHDYEPPLGDAEAWKGARAEAHQSWVAASQAAIAAYAIEGDLTRADEAAVQTVVAAMQTEIGSIRRGMEAGEIPPITGRQEITAARETCDAEVAEILGEQGAAAFRDNMRARVPGGIL